MAAGSFKKVIFEETEGVTPGLGSKILRILNNRLKFKVIERKSQTGYYTYMYAVFMTDQPGGGLRIYPPNLNGRKCYCEIEA